MKNYQKLKNKIILFTIWDCEERVMFFFLFNNNNKITSQRWHRQMYLEKREEEDLPASKTALTHRYNDSKTT